MPFLPDATAKIYRLADLVNPMWVGITDASGRVVDAGGQLPSLSYGDYRVVIEKCDYDTETSDFRVPEISLLNLTVGCSSAITAHELFYNHALIGSNAPGQGYYTGNGTANRAIPHGLGRHPVEVRILQWETGRRHYLINGSIALIYVMASAGFDYWGVSGVNATNFYVGNATSYAGSANENAIGYQWVAI